MARWRWGIIGCGWAGEQHVKAIKSLPERAELLAAADIKSEVARAKAQEWGVQGVPDQGEQRQENMTERLTNCE